MAKKKSINPKLNSKSEKPPKAKQAKVEELYPGVPNKDSVTKNIKSISAKSVKESSLGKTQRVALSQKLAVAPKKKK